MVYKGKGGKHYNLENTPFAQGGEGRVFNIIGEPQKVAKLYKHGLNDTIKERTATFTNNENTKNVSGNGNYIGGLIGYQSSAYKSSYPYGYTYLTISNCRNSGNIAGNNYVGGILAYGLYCTATDSVWASNSNIGTVTGSNSGMLYGYIG